ncbi:MAG: terminase large subunit [Clostridiales bacterium]|nr:terminase large subunit [Roseburia sp.]MDD7635308.1 terminase large subunit [Clostridiales bacterium]MDY4113976.1 terminase TerL endonuclease subunit [Roseburia sp.]
MIKYPLAYNPILEYWQAIESGQEVVCNKTRVWYQHLVDQIHNPGEYRYDANRANHVIEFAENFCRVSKGKGAGTGPVKLELWEKAHLAAVFGFVDKFGIRQCQESMLIVGKKNGKSLIASVVGLYMLVGDGEPGPEVYAVATKKDQSKIIWGESKKMVKKSPTLLKRIKPLVAELSSEDFNDGTFKPLASDSDTLDGLNVHCVLMDEIHQWKNGLALYDIMADGTSAREQPLIYITSTAGTIRKDIYDIKYEYAERVINALMKGEVIDEHFFPFIYELDDRSEWVDENCWKKANPGLGTIKNIKTLRNKVEKAKKNPRMVKNLVCKEFNIRETSESAWLTFNEIQNEKTFDISELNPRYGIGGADLSSTTDLTCATILFQVPDDDDIYVMQMYFLPEDLLEQRVNEDKIPYDVWNEMGLLRLCDGNKVHYRDVVRWFEEVEEELDIYIFKVGYDSWSADYFVQDMKNRFGADVMEPVIQGKKTLSSPMKNLGADICAKRINYNQNPILEWCLYNTSVDVDKNDNIQPCKGNDRTKRIDGLASLLDAYVAYENNMEEYMSVI